MTTVEDPHSHAVFPKHDSGAPGAAPRWMARSVNHQTGRSRFIDSPSWSVSRPHLTSPPRARHNGQCVQVNDDGTQPAERPRLVSVGIVFAGLGGVLLASTFVFSPPSAVPVLGWVLFLSGLVVVGAGGGWKTVWDVAKALFP